MDENIKRHQNQKAAILLMKNLIDLRLASLAALSFLFLSQT
jgi:hypothetical protein